MDYRIYDGTEKSQAHPVNEDSYMFSEYVFQRDKSIRQLVVADGMGGLEDGEKASSDAVNGFLSAMYSEFVNIYLKNAGMEGFSLSYAEKEVERAMVCAINSANHAVCSHAASPLRATGTTISAVCIMDDFAVVANVGDSPVFFYKKRTGQLRLVSTLQTQAEQEVADGLYERYSADYYANEHRIYCSLGQYNILEEGDICVSAIGGLSEGDMILMGSDGAFGRLQIQEILELIQGCPVEEEDFILPQLFELARMDKEDDQTAFLYVVAGEGD